MSASRESYVPISMLIKYSGTSATCTGIAIPAIIMPSTPDEPLKPTRTRENDAMEETSRMSSTLAAMTIKELSKYWKKVPPVSTCQ